MGICVPKTAWPPTSPRRPAPDEVRAVAAERGLFEEAGGEAVTLHFVHHFVAQRPPAAEQRPPRSAILRARQRHRGNGCGTAAVMGWGGGETHRWTTDPHTDP